MEKTRKRTVCVLCTCSVYFVSARRKRRMLCPAGIRSLRQYQDATLLRAEARDDLLLSSETREECEELLFFANERYGDAFVGWVNHRGLCVECRSTSVRDDLTQFMSV